MAKLKIEVEGFELLGRLGSGGQATVYKARRTSDARIVAIKILHSGPHASEAARARLKRETAALLAIKHPNIVHAIAAGRTRSGLGFLEKRYDIITAGAAIVLLAKLFTKRRPRTL